MDFVRHTNSEDETRALGRTIAGCLQPRDLLALYGELGAGKTFLVRAIVEALGINPQQVSSPTFTISQEYHDERTSLVVVHIDAYRLGSADELETIGWDDLIARDDCIIAVEWADRIADQLPTHRTVRIEMEHISSTSRALRFVIPEVIADRFRTLQPRTRPCRTCQTTVAIDAPFFPFCSERCRLIDLGEWFNEKHTISRPITEQDLE